MSCPSDRRIFLGTALVVVAVLGVGAAGRPSGEPTRRPTTPPRAPSAPPRSAIERRAREPEPHAPSGSPQALVQVPAYVSRIGESLRAGDRANLLDQADELRGQTGADWVLITDGAGVLKAWTAQRGIFDEDFSRGALIGRALEGQADRGTLARAGRRTATSSIRRSAFRWRIPGATTPFGVVVAALRVDSAFAAQLQRHTDSEILFFSLDTRACRRSRSPPCRGKRWRTQVRSGRR